MTHEHVFKGDYGKDDAKQLHAYCSDCGQEMDWPDSRTFAPTQPMNHSLREQDEVPLWDKIALIISKHGVKGNSQVTTASAIAELESLYKEELKGLIEAVEAVLPYLEPSANLNAIYLDPVAQLRNAADELERKEAAIAHLKALLERTKLTTDL